MLGRALGQVQRDLRVRLKMQDGTGSPLTENRTASYSADPKPARKRVGRLLAVIRRNRATTLVISFSVQLMEHTHVGKIRADTTSHDRHGGIGLAAVAASPSLGIENSRIAAQDLQNPSDKYTRPPFNKQSQPWPGLAGKMDSLPDHGEDSYRGSGRLA